MQKLPANLLDKDILDQFLRFFIVDAGRFTMGVSGTVTVSNTNITANSLVNVFHISGGNPTFPKITLNAGTGFTVQTQVADTAVYGYIIINPLS